MSDKVLATFRIDPDEWEEFKSKATQDSSNASAMLLKLVRSYIASDPLSNTEPVTVPNNIDERLNRLDSIEQRLRMVADRMQLASTAPAVNLELDNVSKLVDERIQSCLNQMGIKPLEQIEEMIDARLKASLEEIQINPADNAIDSKVTEEFTVGKVQELISKWDKYLEGWIKKVNARFKQAEERLSKAEELNKLGQVQVHKQEIDGRLEEVDKRLEQVTDVLDEINKLIDEYQYDPVRDRTLSKLKAGKDSPAGKAIAAFISELSAENQENTGQS
ncbi:MAG: hypothetical protein V7K67_02310 [Nostoc sp.]|uniref:hypothetical protein n=1 Tax=Nostoc sp. TaxID=1180 RepID=UPI002FF70CC2